MKMKKRIQKAVGKTLPVLALSLFLVFLLSWTFVPYTRENVARHDFTGYTAGIKNNALQQEYPDDFLHLVWQPTDEETAEILTFLRQLRPVQRMISIRARAFMSQRVWIRKASFSSMVNSSTDYAKPGKHTSISRF